MMMITMRVRVQSSDSDISVILESDIFAAEAEDNQHMPEIQDNWESGMWHSFIDDDDYFSRLYKNGEIYEEKRWGKIMFKPWVIFIHKNHLKDTLRDYCI